ncbi:MAG: phage major capsid protein [Desulfosalsimonadaceae bacterium]
MSLLNQLNATTEYYWLNTEPQDILNKASALLWKLMGLALARDNWEVKPHELVDGGKMIKVMLEYANSNSGEYGAQTVINQSKKDIFDAARFRWAGLYGSNTLNLDDLTQNTGDEAIIALTKKYKDSIIKAARVQMAADVIAAATTGNKINGLGDLFNTTTSTEYGSIDEDEMADWKANVITTAEAICFEVMQKIFRTPDMGENDEMIPDFCVTSSTLRDAYERSLHPQQRYSDTNAVEAGWRNITHKGAPIVADSGYTMTAGVGTLDALNTRTLHLRSHKDYNFTTPVWVDKTVLGQPDVISANTRWRGNLFCTNRKLNVRHTNLMEPV